MARRVAWLDRLDPITRTVSNSVRSHWDRDDLAALFNLKERSTFTLLSALPKLYVGRSILVERSALLAFLERLRAADDPAAALAVLRTETPAAPRRKLREFKRTEVAASLDELPHTIRLVPGDLQIRFQTMEELAYALTALAEVLQEDFEAFANLYEPPCEPSAEELARREADKKEAEWFRDWRHSPK